MSGGGHFLTGKIGDYTVVQTSSGKSVYVFDEKSGAVILHTSLVLGDPFKSVEELLSAAKEMIRKADEMAAKRNPCDEWAKRNPCETCRKKHRCPKICYPRRDYERAIGKRGGRRHDV